MEALGKIENRWDAVLDSYQVAGPQQRVWEMASNQGFFGAINEGASSLWLPSIFPHRPYSYVDNSTNINVGNSVTVIDSYHGESAVEDKKKEKKEEDQRASIATIIGVAVVALGEFALLWWAGSRYKEDRALFNEIEAEKSKLDFAQVVQHQEYKRTALKEEMTACQKYLEIRQSQDKAFLACGAVGTALMLALTADMLWKRNIWHYRIWSTCLVVQPILGFVTLMLGPSARDANNVLQTLKNQQIVRHQASAPPKDEFNDN